MEWRGLVKSFCYEDVSTEGANGKLSCKNVYLKLKLRYNYKSSVGVLVDTNTQKERPSSPHIG